MVIYRIVYCNDAKSETAEGIISAVNYEDAIEQLRDFYCDKDGCVEEVTLREIPNIIELPTEVLNIIRERGEDFW